jgi:hypothetical protein
MRFFLLVFALSFPLWFFGALTGLPLMPGLSVSALMTFCPLAAALMFVAFFVGALGEALGRSGYLTGP